MVKIRPLNILDVIFSFYPSLLQIIINLTFASHLNFIYIKKSSCDMKHIIQESNILTLISESHVIQISMQFSLQLGFLHFSLRKIPVVNTIN